MKPPSNSLPGEHPDLDDDDAALIGRFAAQQRRPGRGAFSAARHFLEWARSRKIALRTLDAAAVELFARHHCRCRRYSPDQLRDPGYMANVRRFFRYLQQAGVVPDGVNSLDGFLAAFALSLDAAGYSRSVRCTRFSQARHFVEWVRQSGIPAGDIDNPTVEQFAGHDCRCGIRTKRGVRVAGTGCADRRRGARQFVDFLRQQGVIPPAHCAGVQSADPRLARFEHWLRHERGVTGETVRRYRHEAGRWLGKLGADPADWDAAAIRAIVLGQGPERSRASTLMTVTVLRALLRFLVSDARCSPSLLHAVPPAIRRKLSTLPRAIPSTTIEAIVASCGTRTPVEVRDRAIVLLLARVGLRAGDVWQLGLSDIDWQAGRLRLHGKGRRGAWMPLPQDAGDALLDYIETARPHITHERVFVRVQAPFTPLRSSAEIAGVVARVLRRGGFSGLPTGAHVFRHSLASAWLRDGANLDQIGVALRHASRDTTAIYAKADIETLSAVAQSWPGAAS